MFDKTNTTNAGFERRIHESTSPRRPTCPRKSQARRKHLPPFPFYLSLIFYKKKVKLQLDEDGLNLWRAALRNATSTEPVNPGTPALIDLAPAAIGLLSENLDLLGTILTIIESYIIIGGEKFFQVPITQPPSYHSRADFEVFIS